MIRSHTADPTACLRQRSFLLLQGPASPFFQQLSNALQRHGAKVHALNFNGGDAAYRRSAHARLFRAPLSRLPETVAGLISTEGITDAVMFGDCRPVHRAALPVTRAAGVRNHIMEEGYYRPWWFTLEREGVNRYSPLPRDPDWYLRAVDHLPERPRVQHFHQPFAIRACHDVAYHLAGALNPLVFPAYQTHAAHAAPAEYAGYIRRFARLIRDRAADRACASDWLAGRGPLFVLPLQLDGDTQISVHSRFSNMDEAIEEVLGSFARDATPDALLLVKNHPLDYHWRGRRKALARRVAALNLQGRVGFIESGPLEPLLDAATGVVTVNSTVGLAALGRGRAVCTLGEALYHLCGLTHQGPLARFWQHPTLPDANLYAAFSRVVMQLTQINGGLYGAEAIDIGIKNLLPRLAANDSPVAELTAKLHR